MWTIESGAIRLADTPILHRLRASVMTEAGWSPIAWTASAGASQAVARLPVGEATLSLTPADGGTVPRVDWRLTLKANRLTRLRLELEAPGLRDAFHVIPGCIHGDNALAHAEPGHLPNLTHEHRGNVSCSPYWELRADRAASPVAMLAGSGVAMGIAIAPYADLPAGVTSSDEGFIRNGLFVRLGDERLPHAVGVTFGYRNDPVTFLNKDQWLPSTEHRVLEGETSGSIYLLPAEDRRALHAIVRDQYAQRRDPAQPTISREDAAFALLDAFQTVNWQERFRNFSNMRCIDAWKNQLTAWRSLAEVGWTGGGVIGYPMLIAAERFDHGLARQRARERFDWVSRAYNPDSGLLWDVCGEEEGNRVDWWWSGYVVQGVHCAYTNGSGVYYTLKAIDWLRSRGQDAPPAWLDAALKVLDTMLTLQLPSGSFGYTYRVDRREIADAEGFAGVWFAAAMVLAHKLTGNAGYLDAAWRAIPFYHHFVADLYAWGAPMDTWKAVDQEGNLGLIRAAALLYDATGDKSALDVLRDAADYEYLWRYAIRARPQHPPLKGSAWSACGGSITSVSNPHVHNMGIYVNRDLRRLAAWSGDDHHLDRATDGDRWARQVVELYPEVTGYGQRGVVTERFCPSDGLTIETFPDGTPSSMWFSYNGWAASAMLEGLTEAMEDDAPA